MTTEDFKNILKYLIYIGIGALLFTPFIVSNSLLFPYITGKAYFFRIIVTTIFFLWVILAIYDREYRPKKSFILYSLLAFCVSILISNILGPNWTASFWSNYERMEGYITIIHLLALFLVASHTLKTQKHWDWFFNGLILSSFLIIISAFSQMLENGFGYRIDTRLGNSTYLGGYMLMLSFISLFMMIRQFANSDFSKKISIYLIAFYKIAFILQTIILFQTGTRGAMIGWFVGLFVFAVIGIFGDIFSKKQIEQNITNTKTESSTNFLANIFIKIRQNIKWIFSLIIVVLIIFISAIFYYKDSDFIKNNVAFGRLTSINLSEGTANARILNWQIAWQGFSERPILGWGQSNYNLVFDKYYLPALHGNETFFDRAHNIIFDWLIAGGFVGLILFLLILDSFIYTIWSRKNNLKLLEKSVLFGFLSAYFIHNLFVFDTIVSYFIFFMILAYAHSISATQINFMQKDLSEISKKSFAVLAILSIPIFIYYINIPSYLSSKDTVNATKLIKQSKETGLYEYFYPQGIATNLSLFQKAIDRNTFGNSEIRQKMFQISENVLLIDDENSQEIKDRFLQTAIDEMIQQAQDFPYDAKYKYLVAMFFARFGDYVMSEKYFNELLEVSPNKQATRLPLISVYQLSGQKDKAYEFAKETYLLDKSHDDIWLEYAKASFEYDKKIFDLILEEAFEENKSHRVKKFLEILVEKNPTSAQTKVSLAAFYYRIGDIENSLKVLDLVSEQFPNLKNQIEILKKDVISGTLKVQ
ncbi:MAG TPA: O-antigen ligase family protein [Candidatus Paceibacterota bacterium]|nr:O-antigen ligase family protein [Candidatus Paceibacterota bacterium]